MAKVNTEKTFDALAIRDTADHTGTTINNFDFQLKTIIVENELNEKVTFQCQASVHADFSNSIDVGATWDANASENMYQSCETFFPYMRLIATCDSTPSSGNLTVHFVQYGV